MAKTEIQIDLANHFKVGNVIFSDYWRSYDLVLDFHPAGLGVSWSVDVVECNADGIPTHGSWKRNHCTYPDTRDKIAAHVDTLDVVRTFDRPSQIVFLPNSSF